MLPCYNFQLSIDTQSPPYSYNDYLGLSAGFSLIGALGDSFLKLKNNNIFIILFIYILMNIPLLHPNKNLILFNLQFLNSCP